MFQVKRPMHPILEREQELDSVHRLVNEFPVVHLNSQPAMGKDILIQ